ncbi:DUF802 domain-containing protein [Bordetella sp. 2513F-2]
MTRYLIPLAVFVAGLAAVCWIGAGYAGSNPLALAVTALIGAFYLAGALELQRHQRANAALERSLAGLSTPPSGLQAWLDSLPPGLRNAVRLRIEGERAGLPGPVLTPYLVGLLVLLGMLGTFLGMVATLRGTGAALQSATDLQAIRASLAAPVQGLGFAFGTSIAGVASSAALGLLSALSRRERFRAAQRLDAAIATSLRPHSRPHQREEAFRLLQKQADVMPLLVDRLQAMTTALELQSRTLNERLLASQEAFHGKTEAAYARLLASVEQSMQASAAHSARAAGEAIQPAVEATMSALAREASAWHDTIGRALQRQLDGMAGRFEATTGKVAETWNQALAGQQRTSETMAQDLRSALQRYAETFEQRSAELLEGISRRLETAAGNVSAAWNDALARQEQASGRLAEESRLALAATAGTLEHHTASLLRSISQSHAELQTELAVRDEQRLAAWTGSLGDMAATLRQEWEQATRQAAARQQEICDMLARTADAVASQAQEHARATLAEIDRLVQAAGEAPRTALALQADLAAKDEQRLAAWTGSLDDMAARLRQEWEQATLQAAGRQQEICDMLARTASELSSQTREQASSTIAEVRQLVQAAVEAPKAAADVIGELRQKLTEGMARDNAMLEERNRLLETLGTLLDAVNNASTEQRSAVDALVSTSAELLDRVGTQLADKVGAETGKLAEVAAQVTGSAVEVASLGEAFGTAVQIFSESNEKLLDHLQRIEAALEKSMTRSDEQLAYYVAQAREVVDLSMLSQKQILEDLQQLAVQRAPADSDAA